ncbi:MAG: magnesium transporter [Thermoanaerobaculia bacterium]|nr:magnesium transporter [Thermoanaerobaculia bacterium]
MEVSTTSRSAELQGRTVRRLLRRGARGRISKVLAKIRPEDVAFMLRTFTPLEQFEIFKILVSDFGDAAPSVLLELDPQARLGILSQLTPDQVAQLLDSAKVDDAVSLLDSLPEDLKEQVLAIVDLEDRFSDVQAHLVYDDDTAGRIMDTEFMALTEDTLVQEAIERVREFAQEVEMISYLYVVDKNDRLVGVTPLRNLLLAQPSQTLGELMNASIVQVHTDADQEEVAQLASRYDLLAIPVVDGENRLAGIVTIDDIVDIFKEEATEDFYKMAGTSDDELVYQDRSFKVAGIRLPWILFNLVGLLGAGILTTRFEQAFDMAVLVGFIPVIMGMAGNIGSQTSTIAVRGLATGRLNPGSGEIRTFLWQQLKVGSLLGITCAALVALASLGIAQLTDYSAGRLELVLAVSLSLLATVLLASLNGALIPVLFQRIGFDPAVASGPLVTTANDVLGVLIYFSLTTALFRLMVAG